MYQTEVMRTKTLLSTFHPPPEIITCMVEESVYPCGSHRRLLIDL